MNISETELKHMLKLAFFEGAEAMKEWMFQADNVDKESLNAECEHVASSAIERLKLFNSSTE